VSLYISVMDTPVYQSGSITEPHSRIVQVSSKKAPLTFG